MTGECYILKHLDRRLYVITLIFILWQIKVSIANSPIFRIFQIFSGFIILTLICLFVYMLKLNREDYLPSHGVINDDVMVPENFNP